MQGFVGASGLFLLLLLQLVPAQVRAAATGAYVIGRNKLLPDLSLDPAGPHHVPEQILHLPDAEQPTVMGFMEVLAKSMCRPMEQLVDVEREFPEEVEYMYVPACVPLWRCSGCCTDEMFECHPTIERNITLQVMRILPIVSLQHVELTFVEHQQCECRPSRTHHSDKSSSKFLKNRLRRRKHKKNASSCGKCRYQNDTSARRLADLGD